MTREKQQCLPSSWKKWSLHKKTNRQTHSRVTKVIQENVLERHYGQGCYFKLRGRVRERLSKEGTSEWRLSDRELAKGRCGGGVFWTEITASTNALKVGCQI